MRTQRRHCQRCEAGVAHDFKHGSSTGYKYHRCRCPECTAYISVKNREYCERNRDAVRRRNREYHRSGRRGERRISPSASTSDWRPYYARNKSDYRRRAKNHQEKARRVPVSRSRSEWSSDEDSLVMRTDMTVLEMAYATGRSYQAVTHRRHRIKEQAA